MSSYRTTSLIIMSLISRLEKHLSDAPKSKRDALKMITSAQLRAARALSGINQHPRVMRVG